MREVEYAGYVARNIPADPKLVQQLMPRWKAKYRWCCEIRTVVMDNALLIENSLAVLLLHILVGGDYRKHRILRALIFEAEFCSFFQLLKMLRLLCKQCPDAMSCLSEREWHELRADLSKLIKVRNMFAHGEISIDAPTEKVFIVHYCEIPIEKEITEEFLPEFKKSVRRMHKKLLILNKHFRENEFTGDIKTVPW